VSEPGLGAPSHPPGPPSQRGRARRERILNAAIEQFRRRGFPGTSIDDIGAAAGVTGPALYHHFRNKQELLAAAMWRVGDDVFAGLAAAAGGGLSPEQRFERVVRTILGAILEHRATFPLLWAEDRYLTPEDLDVTWGRRRQILGTLADAIAGVRPDLSPAQVDTMTGGIQFLLGAHTYIPSPIENEHDLKELLVQMALALVRGTVAGGADRAER
jgi:AcrR family transcriptional regulator